MRKPKWLGDSKGYEIRRTLKSKRNKDLDIIMSLTMHRCGGNLALLDKPE